MQKSSLDIVLNAYFLVPQKKFESEYDDGIFYFWANYSFNTHHEYDRFTDS